MFFDFEFILIICDRPISELVFLPDHFEKIKKVSCTSNGKFVNLRVLYLPEPEECTFGEVKKKRT